MQAVELSVATSAHRVEAQVGDDTYDDRLLSAHVVVAHRT
jgi:hypothetical protein